MITAQNYAAQAERGLMIFAATEGEHPQDREFAKNLAEIISDCEHFVIPDDGEIFDDGLKGLQDQELNLPFKAITVEFFVTGKWAAGLRSKAIVVATEDEDSIIIYGAAAQVDSKAWFPLAYGMKVPKDIYIGKRREKENSDCRIMCPGIYGEEGAQGCYNYISSFELCLEELLEALACRNVSTVNHQDASPANYKRIKAGKLPFYETKMLMITSIHATTGKSANSTGSHASPRQHLRRGHIRRLPIGNIWVNSCVVGDAKKGIIEKSYAVRN